MRRCRAVGCVSTINRSEGYVVERRDSGLADMGVVGRCQPEPILSAHS
jgi:hypothetical protein